MPQNGEQNSTRISKLERQQKKAKLQHILTLGIFEANFEAQ